MPEAAGFFEDGRTNRRRSGGDKVGRVVDGEKAHGFSRKVSPLIIPDLSPRAFLLVEGVDRLADPSSVEHLPDAAAPATRGASSP